MAAASVWVVLNYQTVEDWWVLRSYEPSQEIAQLADDSFFNEKGRDLFYVSDPLLEGKASFNEFCPFPERSLVLGCYNGEQIFILDVEPGKTEIVEPVTAAHEMLHAAYKRLSGAEKTNLNQQLQAALESSTNQRIKELVEEYRRQDPESVPNELHSIIGTEQRDITPELEAYYAQYFTDRSLIVSVAEQYEAVFLDIERSIMEFDAQLSDIKQQIDNNELILATINTQIATQRVELEQLLEADNITLYNSRVPGFNALVSEHNSLVEQTRSLVAEHNEIVAQRNAIALEQNDLVQSLDSKFIEL